MKNDLKRFEIADAQADCTVAWSRWFVSSWCRGVSGEEAQKRRDTRDGGGRGEAGGWSASKQAPFFWTVELSSNSCASLTRGRQQYWERGCLGQMDLPGATSPLTSHDSFSY